MATETESVEYIQKYNFVVEIPQIDDGVKFSEASGFASEFSQVEQPEGGRVTNDKKPGKRQYDDLTLKQGATTSLQLWQWHESLGDAVSGKGDVPVDVRTITVRALGKDGETRLRYVFYEAWPKRYVPGDFDAGDDGENQIREVVFAYDRFEILKAA